LAEPDLRALTALRRLRKIETDASRRDLGEAMTHENALAARDDAIRCELEQARRHSGEFDREAFAAWFERMRASRALLVEEMREAAARAATARLTLARRRVAETAAEEALANATAAQEAAVARREQMTLEDVARALKLATGGGPTRSGVLD
jgi:hypothetical protein